MYAHALADTKPFHLDQRIRATLRVHRQTEHGLAQLLVELKRIRGHIQLGFASMAEYARVALQLNTRKLRTLIRIGKALPRLPALAQAMESGSLPYTKVRELLRVITPDTETQWIERARNVSSRELETHVGHCRKGDPPPDPEDFERAPARVRRVIELDRAADERLRAVIVSVRAQMGDGGDELDDGAILDLVCQRVLHDLDDDAAPTGRRYQTVLQVCPLCQEAADHEGDVRDTLVLESCCDAEVVDMQDGPDKGKLSRTIPPKIRRLVLHRDKRQCRVPGCTCRLWLDEHHLRLFSSGGGHKPENLVVLCTGHHRLVHEGRLSITGDAEQELRFEFLDGRVTHG